MTSKKSYEIAFELGAKMDSSVRTAFASANRQMSDLNQETANLDKGSGRLSKTMGVLGGAVVAAGAAIAGLSAGALAAASGAAEFNASMNQIQASTGMTAAQMGEIHEISKNLYKQNLGENFNDLGDAISQAQSVTKLAGKELENATANALIYRDVFKEDISESIKATDTMMRNFGVTNTEAFNLLAQGAQNGLNKSNELLDSANEYAPHFAALGFEANEMFNTFSAGLEAGAFNLDKVGDAVKEFNIRAKDGSDTSAEAFKALNMNAEQMTQTFARGGPEAQKAFQQVVQAISSVEDPAKRNAIGVQLFGTMFEDLEADVIAAMGTARKQFDMTKATMEDIQDIKYDSVWLAFQGIARQLQVGIVLPIGQKVLPVMQKLSDSFSQHMPMVEKFVQSSLNRASSSFTKVREVISSVFNNLAPVFGQLKTVAMPILQTVAQFFMNIWSQVAQFWSTNGAQIIQAAQNVFGFLLGIVKFIAPAVLFIVNSLWQNVKGVFQGGLNVILGLVKVFSSLFTGDWAGIWEGVKQLFGGAIQFLWNLWNLLLVGRLVKSITVIAKVFWGFLRGLGQRISTNVQYYYHMFVNGFYRIGTGILQAVGKAFGAVIGVVRNAVGTYIKAFQMARTFGVNIFMSIVSAVRNVFSSAFGFIRTTIGNVISAAISRVSGFISSVGSFLTTLWTRITSIFAQIQVAMTTPFTALRSIVSIIVGAISGLVRGMFNGVVATGRGAINGLISAANAAINGINGISVTVPNWVPGVGGSTFGVNIPNIPMLAQGGITTGPTLAMIGEGAEQEAVLPLSKLEALLNTPSGGTTNNINNDQPIQVVYSPQIIVQGNADEATISQALGQGYNDFKRWMQRYESERKRLSF